MDAIQDIVLLILTIGGIVLTVILITVMLRSLRLLQQAQHDLKRISDESVAALRKSQQLAARAEEALTVITDNRPAITNAVENMRKMTENIYRLENILQQQVEPSVIGLANRLVGIRRGIDSFLSTWLNKR